MGEDRSVGHAGRGVARASLGEVERRKIEQALKEAARQPRAARRRCCRSATRRCMAKLKEHGLDASRQPSLKPDFLRAPLVISFSVTSSTIAVAPIAVGSTKCSRPGHHLLVVLHRLEDLRPPRRRRSAAADRGSR